MHVPTPVFALVGVALQTKQAAARIPDQVTRAKDLSLTTALQLGYEARCAVADQYAQWARSGERALAQWHAERVLNARADRVSRSVTPAAARAAVSARDGARRVRGSKSRKRLVAARRAAAEAWRGYLAAADDSEVGRYRGAKPRQRDVSASASPI